jgi:hypothetical protein
MKLDKQEFRQASYAQRAVFLHERHYYLLQRQFLLEEQRRLLLAYQYERAKGRHPSLSGYLLPFNDEGS